MIINLSFSSFFNTIIPLVKYYYIKDGRETDSFIQFKLFSMKILIAAPVNNREKVLPYYLKYLLNIDYDKINIHFYFLLNNSNDSSKEILKEFKRNDEHLYGSITIDKFDSPFFQDERITELRMKYTYQHLSNVRNKILDYAKDNHFDYLLSVDSDILVPSDILSKLLNAQKPIISSLIYNGYSANPNEPWKYPNIMKLENGEFKHITNWYVKNAQSLAESKIIEVDLTGAISLIHKDVFNSEAGYGFHPTGEDATFSIQAKKLGFNSYCDLSCYSQHIMTEEQLKNII